MGTYLVCEESWNGYFGTSDPDWVATPLEASHGGADRVRCHVRLEHGVVGANQPEKAIGVVPVTRRLYGE